MGMSWKCEPWVLGKVVTSVQGLVLVQTYGSSPATRTIVPCPPEPVAADQGSDGWQSLPWSPQCGREKLDGV